MNIDRDDEYATRYEAAPTIEEQIAIQRLNVTACGDETMTEAYRIESAILASLEKLAALEKPVPVEPVADALLKHILREMPTFKEMLPLGELRERIYQATGKTITLKRDEAKAALRGMGFSVVVYNKLKDLPALPESDK